MSKDSKRNSPTKIPTRSPEKIIEYGYKVPPPPDQKGIRVPKPPPKPRKKNS